MEASSTLRRAENFYYPPAIWALGPLGSNAETAPKDTDLSKDVPARALPSLNSPPKEAEQAGATEREKETAKEVAPKATKPLATLKDSYKEKGVS